MKRVLIIAAHPDDEVLGCGATISKYLCQGVKFKVLFIAEGSSCRFEDPHSKESLKAIAKRNEQAVQALTLLGVTEYEFCNFPCGRLDQVPIIEINKVIERVIDSFQPDTLLTHSLLDVNNDHKIVFQSTLMATRPVSKNHVDRLISYEVLSSSEWSYHQTFSPNLFEVIEEQHLTAKCQALAVYETEVQEYPFPRSEKALRLNAMLRGVQAGAELAEAFYIVREFKQ